jgi:hypothetical protein
MLLIAKSDKSWNFTQRVQNIFSKQSKKNQFIFKQQNPSSYAQNAGFCIKYLKMFMWGHVPKLS